MKRWSRAHAKWIGVTAGALSAICSGIMSFLVHSTAGKLPVTEITFFRALLSLLVVTPFMLNERRALFSVRAIELWLRSVASAISILCFAWNLQHTSIGFASILFNVTPIVVLVLGLFTKAIPTQLKHIVSMGLVAVGSCLCFFGAPIAPGFTVWIVGMTGAVAAGASYTMLQRQSVNWSAAAIIWCLSWMSLLATLILKKGQWLLPTAVAFYPLLLIGAFGLATQLFVTISLRESGLAIGTAMVPSGIGISVVLDALTSHQFHAVPLGGVFIYLCGIIPLIVFRAEGKSAPLPSGVLEPEGFVPLAERSAVKFTGGLGNLNGCSITRYSGSDHPDMQAIRALRALCWPDIYERGFSLEDGFDAVGIHWVVKQHERVIAAARLTSHHDLVDVPDSHLFTHVSDSTVALPVGFLARLVVHPHLRGKGIAQLLDQERRETAACLGCRTLVTVWNPASGVRRRQKLLSDGFLSPDGELALADGAFGFSYVYVMPGVSQSYTSNVGV